MTTYDIHVPAGRTHSGWAGRLKAWFISSYRVMQHAQMLRVLSQCSDEQLGAMGIAREDIPSHAYKCIYGEEQ